MYELNNVDSFTISAAQDIYIYDIVLIASGLITISSDDTLRLFDPQALSGPLLSVFSDVTDVTCVEAITTTVKSNATTVCTAGRDGKLRLIDARSGTQTAEIRTGERIHVMSCFVEVSMLFLRFFLH